MINIRCKREKFAYDMYHIVKSFFPDAGISQSIAPEQEPLVDIELEDGSCFCVWEKETEAVSGQREQKRYINKKLYQTLSGLTGQEHAWGNMTGVRPTKMIMEKLEEGCTEEEIVRFMSDTYVVSEKKTRLGIEIAGREKRQMEMLDCENGYSIYIGIPFCPTTCSYCSFTSYPAAAWERRMDEYVEAVKKELSFIAEVSKEKKLNTIYIGGGTPTTLSAAQMEAVLTHLEQVFSFEHLKEFTIEAGRPDSITREKLEAMRRHLVTRISINPQTMQQKTLDAIGRRHTVEDVVEIFRMARELGFDNINMDLIAGLPGEHPEDMEDTLRQIKRLAPDSLTVHALAMKHGSRLTRERAASEERPDYGRMASELEQMIDMAREAATEMGLVPYYLYRQKNIAGNFENVGYAKVDKAGIYNILIMEERQSIVAAGAGASTKVVLPYEIDAPGSKNGRRTNLIRIENVKDVGEYLSRIDEMIERKGEWLWR